jgi:predicted dehydrogenase
MTSARKAGGAPLRGALLGTGPISLFHMIAWQAIPDVRIVALANRTRSKAEDMGRQFGVDDKHIYADYRDLLEHEQLDFVDIATAPAIHREQVLEVAAHHIDILCQKPFATSMAEAYEMQKACEDGGVRCIVNENWRWRRWYQETKQLLDQGTIGAPRYCRLQTHDDSLLPLPDGTTPFLLVREPTLAVLDKLLVFDQEIHFIDTMRFLLGRIDRVYAHIDHTSPLVKGDDLGVIMLEFRSGAVGVIDTSYGSYVSGDKKELIRGNVDPFVVEGTGGTIELDPYQDDSVIIVTDKGVTRHSARPGMSPAEAYQESFTKTQSHFAQCLRSGETAQNELSDNLETLAAMFAAYDSAATGHAISL